MDKGTIGGSPAATALDRILNELQEPKLTYKISKIIQGFQSDINGLREITNAVFHDRMLLILYDRKRNRDMSGFPNDVESYLKCHLHTLYCQNIRQPKNNKRSA
jgi:hypothetical protein